MAQNTSPTTNDLVEQIAQAFGDTPESPFNHSDRQLHFLPEGWFDLHDEHDLRKLKTALKQIGVYDHSFYPESVCDWLDTLPEQFDHIRVTVAREYKPTLYLEVNDADNMLALDPPGAKEWANVANTYSGFGPTRIERENETTGTLGNPIVPENDVAEPRDDKETVRACWT